jgi:hypothetical protein
LVLLIAGYHTAAHTGHLAEGFLGFVHEDTQQPEPFTEGVAGQFHGLAPMARLAGQAKISTPEMVKIKV